MQWKKQDIGLLWLATMVIIFCEQNPHIKLVRWCNPIHQGIKVTLDQILQDMEEEKIGITYITWTVVINVTSKLHGLN